MSIFHTDLVSLQDSCHSAADSQPVLGQKRRQVHAEARAKDNDTNLNDVCEHRRQE